MAQEKQAPSYDELTAQVDNLTQTISYLEDELAYYKRQLFGSKKDQLPLDIQPHDAVQMTLFDTGDQVVEEIVEEQTVSIPAHQRKIQKKAHKAAMIEDLPSIDIHHRLTDDQCRCDWCCSQLKEIGRHSVRQEVVFQPAQLRVLNHITHSYECPQCKADGQDAIHKSQAPKPPLRNSLGSATLLT